MAAPVESLSKSPHFYKIYGLRVKSNIRIPGFPSGACTRNPDVLVDLTRCGSVIQAKPEDWQSWFVNKTGGDEGSPVVEVLRSRVSGNVLFRYDDRTEFEIRQDGRQIIGHWPRSRSLSDIAFYLAGPILGLVLRLRGAVCLHGCSMVAEGGAIAIVGPAGSGKSTTAAALALRGFPLLSENNLALSEGESRFHVCPGYPRVNLWPDSVRFLFGSEEALPRVSPPWDKRRLEANKHGCRFQDEPAPLRAIYLFGNRTDQDAAPFVESLSPGDAVVALVSNTYMNYLPEISWRRRELIVLGRLAASVPVRRISPHVDPSRLDRLCDLLINDVAKAQRGAGCSTEEVQHSHV